MLPWPLIHQFFLTWFEAYSFDMNLMSNQDVPTYTWNPCTNKYICSILRVIYRISTFHNTLSFFHPEHNLQWQNNQASQQAAKPCGPCQGEQLDLHFQSTFNTTPLDCRRRPGQTFEKLSKTSSSHWMQKDKGCHIHPRSLHLNVCT